MDSKWHETIRPIIIGGDLGAYATARAFHERYGVKSVVIASVSTGAVANSNIVTQKIVPSVDDDDDLVAAVLEVCAQRPDARHIVLASADWNVERLVMHRGRLEEFAVVPYASQDVLERITDKARFHDLCVEAGVPVPRTVRVTCGPSRPVPLEQATEIGYPLVLKAAVSRDYHALVMEGKKKVMFAADERELSAHWEQLACAGFRGELVMQERLSGTDSDMAAVNVFFSPGGQARFALFGRVLLEEHTPGALGNSVAQITGPNPEVVAQALNIARLAGFSGFGNFDLMRRPDTGQYLFLELNPRVGRSGYAVTAAGYNAAEMYVDAYLAEDPSPVSGSSTVICGDLDDGEAKDGEVGGHDVLVGDNRHLFTWLPLALVKNWVDEASREEIRQCQRAGTVTNPLLYKADRRLRRLAYISAYFLNQVRKFRRWHPGL